MRSKHRSKPFATLGSCQSLFGADPFSRRWCTLALLLSACLLATACGGGGDTTAGVGGSGIGGTGITTVTGNVASVDGRSAANDRANEQVLMALVDPFVPPVRAQSTVLSGIQVSGGGRTAVTDTNGVFTLVNVAPSDQFQLSFALGTGQQITLSIGAVPQGALVRVNNVMVDTSQGSASSTSIDVERGDADSGDDGTRGDDNSGPGNRDDNDNINGGNNNNRGNDNNNDNNESNDNNNNNDNDNDNDDDDDDDDNDNGNSGPGGGRDDNRGNDNNSGRG